MAYDANAQKTVLFYSDGDGSSFSPTSRVINVSGTDDVTFGGEQVVQNINIGNNGLDLCYIPWRNSLQACYRAGGSGMNLKRGIISGDSITWDNQSAMTSATFPNSQYHRIAANTTEENFAVAYMDSSNHTRVYLFGQAANGSLSTYGHTTIYASNSGWQCICYNSVANLFLVAFNDTANYYIRTCWVSSASNNVTAGSAAVIHNQVSYYAECCYDAASDSAVVMYLDSTDVQIKCKFTTTVDAANKSATWSDEILVTSGSDSWDGSKLNAITYDPYSKKVVFMMRNVTTDKAYVRSGRIMGSGVSKTITLDPLVEVVSGSSDQTYVALASDPSLERVITSYSNGSGDPSYVKTFSPSQTNLNADTYLGFANNTVTNGQTVKVNTASNISTQSGLTTATKYYVQDDGTVGSTASVPSVMAGISLSSTQLLIKSA